MHGTRPCIRLNIDDNGTCTCNLNHCNIYRWCHLFQCLPKDRSYQTTTEWSTRMVDIHGPRFVPAPCTVLRHLTLTLFLLSSTSSGKTTLITFDHSSINILSPPQSIDPLYMYLVRYNAWIFLQFISKGKISVSLQIFSIDKIYDKIYF